MTFSINCATSSITFIKTGGRSSALNNKTFFTSTNMLTASSNNSEQKDDSFPSFHAFSKNFKVNFSKMLKPELTKSDPDAGTWEELRKNQS